MWNRNSWKMPILCVKYIYFYKFFFSSIQIAFFSHKSVIFFSSLWSYNWFTKSLKSHKHHIKRYFCCWFFYYHFAQQTHTALTHMWKQVGWVNFIGFTYLISISKSFTFIFGICFLFLVVADYDFSFLFAICLNAIHVRFEWTLLWLHCLYTMKIYEMINKKLYSVLYISYHIYTLMKNIRWMSIQSQ